MVNPLVSAVTDAAVWAVSAACWSFWSNSSTFRSSCWIFWSCASELVCAAAGNAAANNI